MKNNKIALVGLVAVTAAVVLTGCGDKFQEQFKDAPLNSQRNDAAVDAINFPDGYSNVATKCDHGNRLYVLFHGDGNYGAISVVPNAKDCQS